jgi:malonate transporter and related proteins
MLAFFLTSSPIFAVVALGWGAARLRLLPPEGFSAFATYAFDLALPALVVTLLSRQPLAEAFDARFLAALLGAGLAVFAVTAALTAVLTREGLRVAGAHAQAATTGNLAFLGVPLLLAVLGERATGPLAMAILAEVGTLMPLGIVLMSVGRERAMGGRGLAGELARATLLNPIVLSVLAGAAVGLSGVRLPAPLERLLGFLGASAGPTALFALGGSLASWRLGSRWRSVAGVVLAKLVLYPALAWVTLRLAGLPPAWVAAGVLIASLPTAANVFVFASRFDAVPERVSAAILLSTLAGAATFPLAAWLVLP